jgi:hypothetical protein
MNWRQAFGPEYGVVRKGDFMAGIPNAYVKRGFPSVAEAQKWLASHSEAGFCVVVRIQ